MAKLIKYLVVDVDNGKWEWYKDDEHHSIATPKIVNNLEIRVNKLVERLEKKIAKGMVRSISNRRLYSKKIFHKIDLIKEELNVHNFMISDFERKVEEIMKDENEGSPLMRLKKMDSPLSRKQKSTISHLYERLDNSEIKERLEKSRKGIEKLNTDLDLIKNIWTDIINLYYEFNPEILISEMKRIRKEIDRLDEKFQKAWFTSDDVTRGLLKKGIHLRVNFSDILNKMVDILLRTLLQSCIYYRKNGDKEAIENILLRLREFGLYDIPELNLQVLLEVKTILEIEPGSIPSYETCYKKIGELHSNIHNKIFIFKSMNFLRKYFPENLVHIVDTTDDLLEKVHHDLMLTDDEGKEIELYIKVLENLMMESTPGKEYFTLNTKLHKNQVLISSKYHQLDFENLKKCLEVIGSDLFRDLIIACGKTILELRRELKKGVIVNLEDIHKIGMATGKTTMIDNYHKAIEEILASLGTFVSNTLKVLVQEMLINTPLEDKHFRLGLEKTYKKSQRVLFELESE